MNIEEKEDLIVELNPKGKELIDRVTDSLESKEPGQLHGKITFTEKLKHCSITLTVELKYAEPERADNEN